MATRASKPISVTLGSFAGKVQQRVESGDYASASEVIRAGLRALEREEALFEEVLKRKVLEALDDPRPTVAQSQVFADLRALHEKHKAG